jgi:hypothetical protein
MESPFTAFSVAAVRLARRAEMIKPAMRRMARKPPRSGSAGSRGAISGAITRLF